MNGASRFQPLWPIQAPIYPTTSNLQTNGTNHFQPPQPSKHSMPMPIHPLNEQHRPFPTSTAHPNTHSFLWPEETGRWRGEEEMDREQGEREQGRRHGIGHVSKCVPQPQRHWTG